MTDLEEELKFASRANSQFKFTSFVQAEQLFGGVTKVLKTVFPTVKMGGPTTVQIEDNYFDDSTQTLQALGVSLRKRISGNSVKLTLKAQRETPTAGPLTRDEHEEPTTEQAFAQLLATPDGVANLVRSTLGLHCSPGPMLKLVSIHNKRTRATLETGIGTYELCLDKYYYYWQNEGRSRWSEIFSEVEIESQDGPAPSDPTIDLLRAILESVLGYAATTEAKLRRALRWREATEDYVSVTCLMCDIVKYSTYSAGIQKILIQRLNRAVKHALRTIAGLDQDAIVFLPTGDGLALIVLDHHKSVWPLLTRIQREVATQNEGASPPVEYRTGIHFGPVFKYTDIREELNFAGSGINLAQRVMDIGENHHILATDAAARMLADTNPASGDFMEYLGEHRAKHGVVIKVYNIYSRDSFGNPRRPPGMTEPPVGP